MKKIETKKIAVSAMLAAVAFLVTMLTAIFKVSGFLSLDLKDAVLSIIALMYGPFYGFISVIVVALVEFVTISTTGLYGLVMNILSSGTFALICGFIYKFKRNFCLVCCKQLEYLGKANKEVHILSLFQSRNQKVQVI